MFDVNDFYPKTDTVVGALLRNDTIPSDVPAKNILTFRDASRSRGNLRKILQLNICRPSCVLFTGRTVTVRFEQRTC